MNRKSCLSLSIIFILFFITTNILTVKSFENNIFSSPIIINGNDEFTIENGVSGGNGSWNNPYLIKDLKITNDNLSENGILISNTNAYFIILNCTIIDFHSNGENRQGIYFLNVTNGIIKESILNNNHKGIRITESNNIIIENCSISNISGENAHGIKCYQSSNIIITYCTIKNKERGVYLQDSINGIVIEKSKIFDNRKSGICGFSHGNNFMSNIVIRNCSIYRNRFRGIHFQAETNALGSGNILIKDCKIFENGITPPNIVNSHEGILFWYMTDIDISNNTIFDNGIGISIIDCRGTIIRNCSILRHSQNKSFTTPGIILAGPGLRFGFNYKPNMIINCDVIDNEIGLQLVTCIVNVFKNNLINNSIFGIALVDLCFPTIQYNNVISNGESITGEGIYAIRFSIGNIIRNWWNSDTGPSGIGSGDGDSIYKKFSILRYRPWLTEPVSDAGRQT